MCEYALYKNPIALDYVPDHLKTPEMCNNAVTANPYLPKDVLDWFISQEMCEQYGDYDLILDFKKRKELKHKIKGELLPIMAPIMAPI